MPIALPTHTAGVAALLTLALLSSAGGASAGSLHDQAERAAQKNFGEYLELLRIPNVAARPADIQRNAEFLVRAFERRGLAARLVQNAAGRPVVLAETRARPEIGRAHV